MGFRKRKEEDENKIKNLKLQDNNQAIDMEALNKAFAGDLSSSKVVNSGQANEVAETANITGGPSLATVQKATPADAIKDATDKKAVSSNIAMAQEGAKILGVGPDSGDTSVGGGTAQGAMSGMATAASMGMVDPVSLAVAGTIGGISGGLNASAQQKAAYKAAKAKAAAEHHGNLGLIEKEKDRKIQGALESMKSAFSRNLQNNKQVKL